MSRFHVVAVTTRGYHLLKSYTTKADAIADALSRSLTSYGVVMRDGTTGKRYCQAELRAA